MGLAKKVITAMTVNGGLVATGTICFVLAKSKILPPYMTHLACGISYIGVLYLVHKYMDRCGFLNRRRVAEEDSDSETEEDAEYAARMKEFEALKPKLQMMIEQQTMMVKEVENLSKRQVALQKWVRESQFIEEKLVAKGYIGTRTVTGQENESGCTRTYRSDASSGSIQRQSSADLEKITSTEVSNDAEDARPGCSEHQAKYLGMSKDVESRRHLPLEPQSVDDVD